MEKVLVKPEPLIDLIKNDLPPYPCWIEPGILPKGGTLLFGGQAKSGKSFLMLELIRALATGTVPFGYNYFQIGEPVKCLLIEQELGKYGLQKRVKKIFENEDEKKFGPNIFYASKIPEMQLDSREGRELLLDLVEKIKPNVLFLDPIGRLQSYDENKSEQIQQLFTNLEYLLKCFDENGMSLVLSHHFAKPSSDKNNSRDPLDPYSFRGSSKWYDCPDTLMTAQKLETLATKWKAWNIKVRFDTRQDESPQDLLLSVNRDQDLRVRFEKTLGETPPPIKKKEEKKAEVPQQLKFMQG